MRAIAGAIAAGGLAVDLVKAAREDARDLARMPRDEDEGDAIARVAELDRMVNNLLVELDAAWCVVGDGYSEDLGRAIQALVTDKLAKQRAAIAQSLRIASAQVEHLKPTMPLHESLLEAARGVEHGTYEITSKARAA